MGAFGEALLAAIVVAAMSALATAVFIRNRYRTKYDCAARVYADKLAIQIKKANSSGGNVDIMARAIVSTRDDLRGRLVQLSSLLNSDIDRLAEEVSAFERNPSDIGKERVVKTLQVLSEKWPIKADQIEIEVRKLLAELGLERF